MSRCLLTPRPRAVAATRSRVLVTLRRSWRSSSHRRRGRCPARHADGPGPARCRVRRGDATEPHARPRRSRPATSRRAGVTSRRKVRWPAGRGSRGPRAGARTGTGAVGPTRPGGARSEPAPVLQPRQRHADERQHRGVLRRRLRRLPVADGDGRVRPAGRRSASTTTSSKRCAPAMASTTRRTPAPGSPSIPPTPCRTRRRCTTRPSSPAWSRARRAVPEVPAPRLPGAVVPVERVVRVSVPRLAVQPRRREEGRPGTPRHGPLPDGVRRQRRRHRRHRRRS